MLRRWDTTAGCVGRTVTARSNGSSTSSQRSIRRRSSPLTVMLVAGTTASPWASSGSVKGTACATPPFHTGPPTDKRRADLALSHSVPNGESQGTVAWGSYGGGRKAGQMEMLLGTPTTIMLQNQARIPPMYTPKSDKLQNSKAQVRLLQSNTVHLYLGK